MWQHVLNVLNRHDEILSPQGGRKSQHVELLWVQVFNLHMPSTRCRFVATRDTMEILSPQGERKSQHVELLWVQVFNLHIPSTRCRFVATRDTMEILSPQETRENRVATRQDQSVLGPPGHAEKHALWRLPSCPIVPPPRGGSARSPRLEPTHGRPHSLARTH